MDTNYDDGLVHCHNWACGPETSEKPQGTDIAAPVPAHTEEEHLFDDGLVHSHDWARS